GTGREPGATPKSDELLSCLFNRGLITFENKTYVLEPTAGPAGAHKLSPAESLGHPRGSCGAHLGSWGAAADRPPPPPQTRASRQKRETLKMTKYVELVIVADNRERQGKDLEKVKQRLIEIANHVDKVSSFSAIKSLRSYKPTSFSSAAWSTGKKTLPGPASHTAGTEGFASRPRPTSWPLRPKHSATSGLWAALTGSHGPCLPQFYRPLNIRVVLVGVEVWNDIDKCSISQDPFTSLHEFLDWRKMKLLPRKSHDNAQLIRWGPADALVGTRPGSRALSRPLPKPNRGVHFQGTTIGMAPITSMCTAEQSGGIVMDHSDSALGAAVTLAHELGHNFGMNHDTVERGCTCRTAADKGGCIMNPSTGQVPTLAGAVDAQRESSCACAPARRGLTPGSSRRQPFPVVFSSCSREDLEASLEKGVGMCLFNLPELRQPLGGRQCGNGFVEEGEECDCGEPEVSAPRRWCCKGVLEEWGPLESARKCKECSNRCCNATTCTLKPDAVCAHGQCCEDCQLKPAGTACRGPRNPCDLPEFCTGASPHCPANVYLHDGHACQGLDGYCYSGVCQTHEQQCVTLWGPGSAFPRRSSRHLPVKGRLASVAGAKPAPGICFERVNSAGDPYGNCGKDSKSSFAKCEARDAQCGKIQCQGGASRPVIGTNAVSIETNIPLQEGGRILCRGTHVYLGDDLPDPGLVLAGTKCAEGKVRTEDLVSWGHGACLAGRAAGCLSRPTAALAVPLKQILCAGSGLTAGLQGPEGAIAFPPLQICLNRRCQNISVFGVLECARQCGGRGVCNNRKNCHCEARWAPPFCDRAGFGGSSDSGPSRQADSRGLTAGVLLAVLCALAAGAVLCLKRKPLTRLLFTNKETTIEKLRCVRPPRPSGATQPRRAPLGQGLMRKPPHASSAPMPDNPRRLPQGQNVDISGPLMALDLPPPSSPQRVLLPLHHAPRAPGVPARPLPASPAPRQAQVGLSSFCCSPPPLGRS
ncbi:Disintegrin and metalloproteinase domain-containing protein 12, partial [Galemys pyrenaicus]